MKTPPLLKCLLVVSFSLVLGACSTVKTLSTTLQKGELHGMIAAASPQIGESDEGGAFATYFADTLRAKKDPLYAVTTEAPLSNESSAAQISQAGREAGADWVLVPTLTDLAIGVFTELEIDPSYDYYGYDRFGRGYRRRGFINQRFEATTRTTRYVDLDLRLFRSETGELVWTGRGRASLSNSNYDSSWNFVPLPPDAPPAPHPAEALAVLGRDSAKELVEFAAD